MELTNHLILDAAIVAIAVLFALIGFMRGVQREIFTTAAILGGWAMATAWTDDWADDLSDWIAVSPSTAGFVLTAGFLVGSLVILGWGAGSAVGSPPRTIGQRMAGGILGGINGVLFASYGLATYRDYLADLSDRALIDSTRIASVVLDDLPWAILIAIYVAIPWIDINGNPVLAIEAANGTQTLTQAAVSIIANLGSPSGLAFDPDANGGDGAVLAIHNFSGSFGTPPSANISCLDLDGAELPGIGSLSTTARGLALDPLRDRLWSSLDIPNFDQLDEFYETLDTSVAGLQPQVATGRSTCVESASGDSHYVEDSPFAGPDDAELLVIRPFAGPLFEDVLTAYRAPHVPESIGSGCGTPTMELTTTWPQGDGSFVTFTLANVPPPFASVALLSLNEIPGGLLLDIVGATGCNLYISPVVAQFALTPPGTASFGVGPGLNGLTLFWQGAAIAPGVNPLGVVTSNAVKWRL